MAEIVENSILIRDVQTKNIMTKSSLPVGGYSVNPYVGCTHGCRYCYATSDGRKVAANVRRHDPTSPILAGRPDERDTITDRRARSRVVRQGSLL